MLNPSVAPQMEVLIATTLAGLVCAGTFTMASMPSAALVFVGLVFSGRIVQFGFVSLDHVVENLMLQAIFGSVMLISLRNMAQIVRDRVRAVVSGSTETIIGAAGGIVRAIDQQSTAIAAMLASLKRAVHEAEQVALAVEVVAGEAARTMENGLQVSQAAAGVGASAGLLDASVARLSQQVVAG